MNEVGPGKTDLLAVVKKTSIGTLAIGAVLLQVLVFRAVGDITTSLVIFGLGYALAKMK